MAATEEIERGQRFGFGENWSAFLSVLDEDRILEAEKSLRDYLGVDGLDDAKFLDIGCGSGIFSLAARRLGATVYSFDFDPSSVACAKELKRRYFADDSQWQISEGSILDRSYIESLGQFEVVYSWGVLHHTDDLWQALYNAQLPLARGGRLFIAIYNDEGVRSAIWETIKRTYCSGPIAKFILTVIFYSLFFAVGLVIDLVRFRNPARRFKEHRKYRGMSLTHDWKDWLGGYPYERAKPSRIQHFMENLGFRQLRLEKPTFGFGNNQFLFLRDTAPR